DVLVIQGTPTFKERRTDTVLNPCLIVEVLSASTKDYDRTDKFRYYRSIAALQEYVLIDQYAVGIEQYTKAEGDAWLFRSYDADVEEITFASVDIEMPIQDIYENVRFAPSA
ncbi:MAG: Uma2 family endonuclease, partial [Cyanobacteria bacterium J06606_4]